MPRLFLCSVYGFYLPRNTTAHEVEERDATTAGHGERAAGNHRPTALCFCGYANGENLPYLLPDLTTARPHPKSRAWK